MLGVWTSKEPPYYKLEKAMEQPLLPQQVVTETFQSKNGVCAPYDPGPVLPPGSIGPALPGTPRGDTGDRSDEEAAAQEADEPLHKLSGMQQVQREARRQWRLALPICTMNVFNVLLAMVSVIFVGHLGAKELAAGALATGVANVTGIAVLVSGGSVVFQRRHSKLLCWTSRDLSALVCTS